MRDSDDERFLQRVAATARQVPPASSDLDDRIMAAVRAEPRSRWRAAALWMVAPRSVRLSPAAALACAAGLAAIVFASRQLFPVRGAAPDRAPAVAVQPAAAIDTVRLVRFVLAAPTASSVTLVGDFNRWSPDATPLRSIGTNGVWIVDVPLSAGRHEYAFVVNGAQWMPDPAAPRAPVADFGTPNSVITITPEPS